MIELKITRKEKNPDYKSPEDMRGVYNQRYDCPPEYEVFERLNVEITDN